MTTLNNSPLISTLLDDWLDSRIFKVLVALSDRSSCLSNRSVDLECEVLLHWFWLHLFTSDNLTHIIARTGVAKKQVKRVAKRAAGSKKITKRPAKKAAVKRVAKKAAPAAAPVAAGSAQATPQKAAAKRSTKKAAKRPAKKAAAPKRRWINKVNSIDNLSMCDLLLL